jgi:hypothetical protein
VVLLALWLFAGLQLGSPPVWSICARSDLGQPYGPLFLVWPLLIGAGAGWLVWRLARRDTRRHTALAVAVLALAQFGLALTTDSGQGRRGWVENTVASTYSVVSNGYFSAATRIESVRGFLRDYPAFQRAQTLKVATHPPGAVLAYWLPLTLYDRLGPVRAASDGLLDALIDRNDLYLSMAHYPGVVLSHLSGRYLGAALWTALWIMVLGALAVWPTYLLGAAWAGRRGGLLAAALVAVTPNTLFYAQSLDVPLMMLVAWGLAGAAWSLRAERGAPYAALGAGVALGVALSVSLGALAALALVVGLVGVSAVRGETRPGRTLTTLALLFAGLALVAAAATLAGADVADAVRTGLSGHTGGIASGLGHRPYWPWVWLDVVDYGLFAGLPLTVTALAALRHPRGATPALALVGIMALLTVSGITRAETERLWVFFNPLLAAAAAVVAAERAEWYATLASQPLQLLLMAVAHPPLVRPY